MRCFGVDSVTRRQPGGSDKAGMAVMSQAIRGLPIESHKGVSPIFQSIVLCAPGCEWGRFGVSGLGAVPGQVAASGDGTERG